MHALDRGQVTLYIERDRYKRLKELVAPKPVSHELHRLIEKRVAELEGRESTIRGSMWRAFFRVTNKSSQALGELALPS